MHNYHVVEVDGGDRVGWLGWVGYIGYIGYKMGHLDMG